MLELLAPIIIGCVSAALTAVITVVLRPLFQDVRRGRVFGRIMSNPYLNIGTKLSRVELQGHPAPLLGPSTIISIKKGEVVLREDSTGDLLPITGVELELLWPIVKSRK